MFFNCTKKYFLFFVFLKYYPTFVLVNVLNFRMDKSVKTAKYVSYVRLMDDKTKKTVNSKLLLVYLELPRFKIKEHELKKRIEQWAFVLKNLVKLEKIPDTLQDDEIFKKLFRIAEIANLPKNEINNYFLSLNKPKNMDFIVEEKNRKIEELPCSTMVLPCTC